MALLSGFLTSDGSTVAANTADKFNTCGWAHCDSYGVARFDLSDLLLGQTALQLRVPIMNSRHVAEPTWKPAIGLDGQIIPPPGVKEGPSEYQLRTYSVAI